MTGTTAVLIGLALAVIAFLYATTGQAGGSGFVAILSWWGFTVGIIRPTALVLNCVVATITTVIYVRAGWFVWARFWRLTILALPAAGLGGRLVLTGYLYHVLVAVCLLWAAVRLLSQPAAPPPLRSDVPPWGPALVIGAGIGFVSGITGIGGGIFLTPVVVMRGWATPQEAAGLAAPFILVNSLAALLAHPAAMLTLSPVLVWWSGGVVLSGWLGATVGSHYLSALRVQQLLATLLIFTSITLIMP